MAEFVAPFREIDGESDTRKSVGQSTRDWFDRSSLPACAAGRRLINTWLASCPEPFRSVTRDRLSSGDDRALEDSLFELYMFALFTRIGFELQPGPTTSGGSQPDFLVLQNGKRLFFLEVTVNHGLPEVAKDGAKCQRLLDQMSPHVRVVGKTVWVHEVRVGPNYPSARRFAGELNRRISLMSDDESEYEQSLLLEQAGEAGSWVEDDASGWALRVSLVPLVNRAMVPGRPFGAVSLGEAVHIPSTLLRDEVRGKLEQHRSADLPLVVAVAFNDFLTQPDESDVVASLAGALRYVYPARDFNEGREERVPDGLWTKLGRTAVERCPAVLTCENCFPWVLPKIDPILWSNPLVPCESLLSKWPLKARHWNAAGDLEQKQTELVASVFGF